MLEQTLGTDTVRTGLTKGRLIGTWAFSAVWLGALVAGTLYTPDDLMHRFPLDAFALHGMMCLVFIVFDVYHSMHYRDRLEFDDQGVTEHRFGAPPRTILWSDVEDVQTVSWFSKASQLQVVAGRQKIRVPLHGFLNHPGAADRFRLRLEQHWQAKLKRMEQGVVRLDQSRMMFAMLAALFFGVIMPNLVSMSRLADDSALHGFRYGPLLGMVLFVVAFSLPFALAFRRAAGPEYLVLGFRRIRLADIETIHIVRHNYRERWKLRGPGIRTALEGGCEFPLLCMYLIRQCRQARFTYDVRAPRGPLEAAFLPLPPGATEELLVAKDEKTADRAARKWGWGLALWMLTFYALLFAGMNYSFYRMDVNRTTERQRAIEQKQAEARPIEGRLVIHDECWHADYTVGGQQHQAHVYKIAQAPPGVKAGDPVPLHYWPVEPGDAWFGELSEPWMPEPPSLRGVLIAGGLAVLFALLAAWLTYKQRRDRVPQPTAVGF